MEGLRPDRPADAVVGAAMQWPVLVGCMIRSMDVEPGCRMSKLGVPLAVLLGHTTQGMHAVSGLLAEASAWLH